MFGFIFKIESWEELNNFTNMDEPFEYFIDGFIFFLDVSCPLKSIRVGGKCQSANWITKEILVSRNNVKFHYEIYL